MIHQIALTTFFGLPLVAYGGILTLLSFLFTASIGYASHHSIKYLPFKWHPRMVAISFIFAIIHGFAALSIFLGY
jgi:fructose-specific phosphotransferase system IIC component